MRLSIERSKLIERASKRLGKKHTLSDLVFRSNIEALNWRDCWINEKAEYIHRRCGDTFLLAWSDTVLIRVRSADSDYYHSLITSDFSEPSEWAYAVAHAIAVELRNRSGSLVDFELDEVAEWLDAQLLPSRQRVTEYADLPLFAMVAA